MSDTQDDGSEAFTRNPGVIHTEFNGEVLALNTDSGTCFSFAGPSARLWQILENPTTAAEAARVLVAEFDVEAEACRKEVQDYFARLSREDLLRSVPAA